MRLAIVDDDTSITSLLKLVAERYGLDGEIAAYNSSTKFNADIENGVLFDYAILDLNFYGDVPGFVCIDKLKKFNPSCRIIILSSSISEMEEKEKVIDQIKMDVYMVKRKPLLPSEIYKLFSGMEI